MRKEKTISLFIEQLRKIPIVQIACDKAGVSRNTIYRWRKEDEKFRKAWDEAIGEGELLVNDMGESQLITLIKEKNWAAISFWLRHHHPKYADKLLINAITNQDGPMSPETEALVRRALGFAASSLANPDQQINGEQTENNSTRYSGGDDKGQESPSGNN